MQLHHLDTYRAAGHRALASFVATATLVTGLFVVPAALGLDAAHGAGSARAVAPSFDAQVLRWTNVERSKRGLRPLRAAPCPRRYAAAHTQRLAAQDRLFHQSLRPVVRSCRGRSAAENVAYGGRSLSPRQVVSMWMKSPGHRANILRPKFKRLGVDTWRSARTGRVYVGQVFTG